jgi:hypothetical protein
LGGSTIIKYRGLTDEVTQNDEENMSRGKKMTERRLFIYYDDII